MRKQGKLRKGQRCPECGDLIRSCLLRMTAGVNQAWIEPCGHNVTVVFDPEDIRIEDYSYSEGN